MPTTKMGTGVWLATVPVRHPRIYWRDHDALFVAVKRFRLRINKPWHPSNRKVRR